MEVDTRQSQHAFDWANDAYLALNDPNTKHQQTSTWTSADPLLAQDPSFTVPSSLQSHATVERYGQITPPEEHSPTDPRQNTRESSIPVEQLRNETFWPEAKSGLSNPLHTSPSEDDSHERSPKRRRTSMPATANQKTPNPAPQQDASDANPQPPKRKRGRPKSQPQMVQAFTTDGFPFQVSSARQSHLEKNRVAAHKCRQRKKEYINGLEGRARDFSSRNKLLKENVALLREEVLSLKNEVLRHAGCGFWAVDEYLARCAGDLLGIEAPKRSATTLRQNSNQNVSFMNTQQVLDEPLRDFRNGSHSSNDTDEFGGLELLKDFDDEDMDELEQL